MTSTPSTVLAIDLGTGGPKAALMTSHGELIAESFVATPLVHTPDGGIEQDAEGWWQAIARASREAAAQAPEAAARVAAVGVAAQWFTTVAIDADARPLMNAISWMDERGAAQAKRLTGPGPRVAGYNPLKLRRWLSATGGAPSLSGHDSLAHVHLIREIAPEVHERARAFIDPGGYLTARMTGRIATSAESATAFWATDTRKIEAIAYDDGLLKLGGLRREQLAEIVPSGAIVGDLLPARAAELGVPVAPVVAATPDIMAAALGSGATADYAAHLYVGTSGWLSCHVPFKKTDPLHNIAALPSALHGRYLMCTEQQVAGEALAHLRDKLLQTGDSYEQLLEEAAATPPGARGIVFTPWLNGERTPLDDAHLRGAYANLSLTSDRGALVRATLEGVALNARWMLECCERFTKRRLDSIALIGGGAINAIWCQVFADALDREVRQIAEPRQATARGAALLAGLALGELSADGVATAVRSTATFAPQAANAATYDEHFANFKAFHKANRRLYRKLNAGRKE